MDGIDVGFRVGIFVGRYDGYNDGLIDGSSEGSEDGNVVGSSLGNNEGLSLGVSVGILLGPSLGISLGKDVGISLIVGTSEGTKDGYGDIGHVLGQLILYTSKLQSSGSLIILAFLQTPSREPSTTNFPCTSSLLTEDVFCSSELEGLKLGRLNDSHMPHAMGQLS